MSDSTQTPVIIYSTPTCAFCRTEKQWLESLGVAYEVKDIEESDANRDELLEKVNGVFTGVPTTDIGGEIIVGFDRPRLTAALQANSLLAA